MVKISHFLFILLLLRKSGILARLLGQGCPGYGFLFMVWYGRFLHHANNQVVGINPCLLHFWGEVIAQRICQGLQQGSGEGVEVGWLDAQVRMFVCQRLERVLNEGIRP
jgi:hypothetical protein